MLGLKLTHISKRGPRSSVLETTADNIASQLSDQRDDRNAYGVF